MSSLKIVGHAGALRSRQEQFESPGIHLLVSGYEAVTAAAPLQQERTAKQPAQMVDMHLQILRRAGRSCGSPQLINKPIH